MSEVLEAHKEDVVKIGKGTIISFEAGVIVALIVFAVAATSAYVTKAAALESQISANSVEVAHLKETHEKDVERLKERLFEAKDEIKNDLASVDKKLDKVLERLMQ